MAKIYVFLADGLEEIEALTPVDLFRRVGDEVTTVSIMGRKEIRGSHDITILADALLSECTFDDGDLFILPGGCPGTKHLGESEVLKALLPEKEKAGKRVAAICAAPMVLASFGMLEGKNATIYPGMQEHLAGATYHDVSFVTDGLITTGHGPGAATEFALELVRLLHGEDKKEELRRQFVYPHA